MSKLKHISGNLIDLAEEGKFDVIVHGANCFNTMNSGIAKEIRARYPLAYYVDSLSPIGDFKKLGGFTTIRSNSSTDDLRPEQINYIASKEYLDKVLCYESGSFAIINAYTQYDFARSWDKAGKVHLDYGALQNFLIYLADNYPALRYGFPYIGCGLAGGDIDRVVELLELFAENIYSRGGEVTLVKFDSRKK